MTILYLLLSVFINICHGKTLEMVHLVYRHGARSPINFYPSDKYQENYWPDGGGRLTQIGMNMEYNLGKMLKQRYMINTSFINQSYAHREVYIRSSDSERCLQSAESQLASFYPPSGYQIWNTKIPWQPVPVHTVPKNEDTILRPDDVYCPRLEKMWKIWKESPEYMEKVKENKKLFDKLSNYSGMVVTSNNIGTITDATICEKAQGLGMPNWLRKLWEETLSLSQWFCVNEFRGDDELGRLLGGSFLWKINDNMKKLSVGKDLQSYFKMNIFSGHDTTLLALSTALDVNIDFPPFSSCIMVELYHSDQGYFVEMLYRNDQTDNLQTLKLKKCNFSCPLDEFIKLTKNRTTEDRKKICGFPGHLSNTSTLKIILIISSAFSIILLVIIGLCFVKRLPFLRKLRHKGDYYLDDEGKHLIPAHS